MVANRPGEPSEPAVPASPEAANDDAAPPPDFYAELNGATTRATQRTSAPRIDFREVRNGTLPGNKYVRVLRAQDQVLKQVTPDYLVASEQLTKPRSVFGKIRRALVGRP
ncbi:MAG: hypothetical protein LC793_00990, partial [Thermomicrobia bacterium]|nr:hypothetical protein [Thermomicrobia bacterium]MCA1722794.1 hypothetical protein [Thermomicrobia bacterium]